MCAIVDANVVVTVFDTSENRPPAAQKFFERVDSGKLILVVGGKLKRELCSHGRFRDWLTEALRNNTVYNVEDAELEQKEGQLKALGNSGSNDTHVLALAQVTGARLLYTDDQRLIDDFTNGDLISDGKVYKTPPSGKFAPGHRRLLDTAKCNV